MIPTSLIMMILLKKDTKKDEPFSTDVSLNNNPSTCGNYIDSKNENLQLHIIRETYPSVIKQ